MKDFILLLVILMCIIGIGIWQVNYLEETSRYLKTDLQYVDYYLNLEKYYDAIGTIRNVKNTWENMEKVWAIFIHHEDIEFVEVSLAEIESYIGNNSKDNARAGIEKLISNIDFTVQCEKVKIENIF